MNIETMAGKKALNYLAKFKRSNIPKNLLYNVYVLYFFLIVSAIFLYTLAQVRDFVSIAIFVLIGFITSFFSKNMVVIMAVALIFSALLKTTKSSLEGFQENATTTRESASDTADRSSSSPATASTTATANGESFPSASTMNSMSENAKSSAISTSVQKESVNELLKDTAKLKELEKQASDLLNVQEQILQGLQKIEPMLDRAEGLANRMGGFGTQ
jgi:hypothetical protein